ncbi:MAG: peptide MFS transporter [Gemmatimonadetes bacterium]|nr:peptide MFS transporter [Gemmatimonadota bacterium]
MTATTGDTAGDRSGWAGHPRGLSTLFFTEMWERFSYYGMRALLILYMTAPITANGLGFDTARAASIYGWYTFGVYAAAIPGGWVADRFLGQYRSVFWGGVIIALGHFSLAIAALPFFYLGLALIVAGTGLLKPNVSTMVGSLYQQNDARRDAGFSIFYMGINIGAGVAPLVVGTLGQRVDWHVGFAAAGVGMVLGLIQYVLGKKRLQPALTRLDQAARAGEAGRVGVAEPPGFTAKEWKRIGAIGVFFVAAILFWGAFEQAGSSLNLFADRMTRLTVLGWSFPSTWFQSLNSAFLIALAPVFAWLWVSLGQREPTSPVKFTLGLLFVGLGFLLLVPAASMAQQGVLVSPLWLTGVYLLHTIGELCLSPVGLSVVTKLAPGRIVGLMMGVWFLATAFGNKLGGWVAGFFDTLPLPMLFGAVAATTIASALVLLALVRPVKKLMGGVH